ncbi:uncharacterized protein LOC130712653 [Lotus japonicus]|uniref:uncharacterized protein LOC130712653 n=1 Tax=Lotus japonicus TaxID=34305 RepID=UPI002583CFB5|nr:uncharacterized protein LOC130712653 [Lotus japonicus]
METSHVEVQLVETTGGLMFLWRESSIQVQSVVTDTNFIFLTLKIPNYAHIVLVGNVYGPHTLLERRVFFEALKVHVLSHDGMVFLGGDFNVVMLGSERSSGGVLNAGDVVFQQFVRNRNLTDLHLLNGEAVGLLFGVPDAGPKPFHYFNHWVDENGFNEVVETWWRSAVYQGWSGYVLQQKLKGLRGKIREWRKGKGAWGVEKIVSLENRLQEVMGAMEEQGGRILCLRKRGRFWRLYGKHTCCLLLLLVLFHVVVAVCCLLLLFAGCSVADF